MTTGDGKTLHYNVLRSLICCVMAVQRLEVADEGADVDIEGGADDKNDAEKKSASGSMEEVEEEEFFVKYKNL